MTALPVARIRFEPLPGVQAALTAASLCLWFLAAYFVFSQAVIARSRSLVPLACGCLLMGAFGVTYLLAFPGIVGAGGAFGHPGTAPSLWWLGKISLAALATAYGRLAYVSSLPWRRGEDRRFVAGALAFWLVATIAAAAWARGPAQESADAVPLVIACAAALAYLVAVTRGGTALDLWVIAMMTAVTCDVLLSAFGGARYTAGWYAARVDALLASAVLPVVFLFDVTSLSRRLTQLAAVDAVSGLANRRALDERLQSYVGTRRRRNDALSLIMLDIDRFKEYNDRYGHAAGDRCLRTVGAIIRAALARPGDFAARYGGEEFVIVLPATDRTGALVVAERVRSDVERLSRLANRSATPVTVSLGVATTSSPAMVEVETILRAADRALYAAKAAGRNCIVEATTAAVVAAGFSD